MRRIKLGGGNLSFRSRHYGDKNENRKRKNLEHSFVSGGIICRNMVFVFATASSFHFVTKIKTKKIIDSVLKYLKYDSKKSENTKNIGESSYSFLFDFCRSIFVGRKSSSIFDFRQSRDKNQKSKREQNVKPSAKKKRLFHFRFLIFVFVTVMPRPNGINFYKKIM